jgi:hypothetical protein
MYGIFRWESFLLVFLHTPSSSVGDCLLTSPTYLLGALNIGDKPNCLKQKNLILETSIPRIVIICVTAAGHVPPVYDSKNCTVLGVHGIANQIDEGHNIFII